LCESEEPRQRYAWPPTERTKTKIQGSFTPFRMTASREAL
jgi:hypothetical protein